MAWNIHKELISQGYKYNIKYSDDSHGYSNHGKINWAIANPNYNIITLYQNNSNIDLSYDEYRIMMRLEKIKKIKDKING